MPITIESASGRGRAPRATFTVARLAMPETARKAADAAAAAAEKVILAGAPRRLSGVGESGAPLTIRRYRAGSATQPQTVLKAIGPWQFIESDTKAHIILNKAFGSRRTRRAIGDALLTQRAGRRLSRGRRAGADAFIGAMHAGAVLTPEGPRVYARHPGTKGQHVWRKGVQRSTPAATLAFVRVVRADLRRQFG